MERIDEMQDYNEDLKSYWNPRAYQKLDSGGRRARKSKMRLGGGWRPRLWRVKVSPKLKILKEFWPKRLFNRFRQAYVRTMLGFAGKIWLGNCENEFGIIQGPPRKEYEERLILQIQKLLLERNRHYAAAGTAPPGEICS